MKGRRAARRMAVDALYEAEIRGRLPVDTFEIQQASGGIDPSPEEDPPVGPGSREADQETIPYARILVEGVQIHQAQIDELLARHADRWAIDRMPMIDRTLLRIAVFELLWGEGIPVPVAINEAVELAKELSTEDSGRFVNGLLGRIAEESSSGPG